MQKIILKYKSKLFLFASFKRSNSDGSFLWWLERKGKSQTHYQYDTNSPIQEFQKEKDKKIGISYHPTGCIHYKSTMNNPMIYGEKLLEITQKFCFAFYSVPAISNLDECSNKELKNNIVIDLGVSTIFENRTTFSLTITPYNQLEIGFCKIDYAMENFSIVLNLENTSFLHSNRIENSFVFMAPEGLFQSQQSLIPTWDFIQNDKSYNEKWALIKYHQKVNSTTDLIIYDQDDENRYRVVFSVPMRISPRVKIVFSNPEYTIKLEQHKDTYLLFQVLDVNGNVIRNTNLVHIISIILDSRL